MPCVVEGQRVIISLLLSMIFSREHCLCSITQGLGFCFLEDLSTPVISCPWLFISLKYISRVYFGDEQDMAAKNGYGLNQMKNLVVLYQQTEILDTIGTYQQSIFINWPQRSMVPLEGFLDFCNLLV